MEIMLYSGGHHLYENIGGPIALALVMALLIIIAVNVHRNNKKRDGK